MPITLPQGDLARAISHDPDENWPTMLEIVAYWGDGRKKRRSVEIDADAFFGRNGHGAPMSGQALITMIERLRRLGPLSPKK